MAQAVTVAGALAVGGLVVHRLVALFQEDFFLFYGVDDIQYQHVQQVTDSQLPLTFGQLLIAAIALVAVIVFVTNERRRLRQATHLSAACRRPSRVLVYERLTGARLFDTFVLRTSSFAGVLLAIWLLQSSLEGWLGGLGLGLEYADWRSLLPLASVFGVCVLAGMLVAAVSIVGLRAIHVLELAFECMLRRRRSVDGRLVVRRRLEDVARTIRELIGCDILSRPPPVAC